jgi:hypothetical protein
MVRSSLRLKTSMWIMPLPIKTLSATLVTRKVPSSRKAMISSMSEHSQTNSSFFRLFLQSLLHGLHISFCVAAATAAASITSKFLISVFRSRPFTVFFPDPPEIFNGIINQIVQVVLNLIKFILQAFDLFIGFKGIVF